MQDGHQPVQVRNRMQSTAVQVVISIEYSRMVGNGGNELRSLLLDMRKDFGLEGTTLSETVMAMTREWCSLRNSSPGDNLHSPDISTVSISIFIIRMSKLRSPSIRALHSTFDISRNRSNSQIISEYLKSFWDDVST